MFLLVHILSGISFSSPKIVIDIWNQGCGDLHHQSKEILHSKYQGSPDLKDFNSLNTSGASNTRMMPVQTLMNFRSHVHIILVLALILCAAHLAASYSGDIHELLTLRDSFADARDVLPSWFDTLTPPCHWHGVQCKANTVEGLDLSGVPLDLPFPKCITEFRALQILNFSNCGFTGQIPENIENLQNLQYLDLSKNRLSGPLPPSLAKMKLLRKLSVGDNSLSGSLTPDLGKLQNLEILDLSMNSFSGILPSSLANLTGLQHLDVSQNGLTGPLFPGIGALEKLVTLDTSSNSLTGMIPADIGRLSNLISLWMGQNGFSGSIPAEIGNLKQLRTLSLCTCKLTGKIPEEISNLKNMTDLNLSENFLEGELPQGLGQLADLQFLVLANSALSGPIPRELGNCTKLKIFELSFNSFSGPIPVSLTALESIDTFAVEGNHLSGPIPDWFSQWTEVESIRLAKNLFTGSLPPVRLQYLTVFSADANQLSGEIPSDICKSKSLKMISLSQNKLTGSISETFKECLHLTDLIITGNDLYGEVPGYLAQLPLITLEMSQNNFSGRLPDPLWDSSTILEIWLDNNQLIGQIPDSIGRLSVLRRLQLDNNLFEGSIPSSVGKLRNLTNLSIHGNRLSGNIPPELFDCSNLVALDLGSNNLSGTIPKAISNLKLLDNLVLSNNQLSGNIPCEICSGFQHAAYPDSEYSQHYGTLDLSYNKLTGQIPVAIRNCITVVELQLQGNRLNSSIPGELAELTSLTFLDLSFNYLSGQIPSWLSPLRNLQSLLLSNNRFIGTLPDNLPMMLPSLVKLNMSSNLLTGSFPKSVFDLKSLTHVDLSLNSLSGTIPFSDLNPEEPSHLLLINASNNHFSGEISDSVSTLSSLSILDLHNNSLTGSLPSSLSALYFLSYLDVSNNDLGDDIPCGICRIDGLSFANFSGNNFKRFSDKGCDVSNTCSSIFFPSSASYLPPSGALSQASLWGIITGALCGFLALVFGVLQLKRVRQKILAFSPAKNTKTSATGSSSTDVLLVKKCKEPLSINLATFQHSLQRLSLSDILKVTENFNKAHIIGDGGFGIVYKAVMPEGKKVAIKRLSGSGFSQGDREFLAEMETIGKVRHRNLVPLLGYCVFSDEQLLVYEYMENGSLDLWLRNRTNAAMLNWPTRFKICLGSACGLSFLHHGFVPHIIHRDVKSSNILLDENFEPRVADFGLARIISAYESHISTNLAGTFGYIPPEYGLTMKATMMGDVYSFGVVVLELLTGKSATGQEEMEGGGNLVGWVRWMAEQGKMDQVFDSCLTSVSLWKEEMMEILTIAKACTADEPWKRPNMSEVVKLLKEMKREENLNMVSRDIS